MTDYAKLRELAEKLGSDKWVIAIIDEAESMRTRLVDALRDAERMQDGRNDIAIP